MQAIPWLLCQVLFKPSALLRDECIYADKALEMLSMKQELLLASGTQHRCIVLH